MRFRPQRASRRLDAAIDITSLVDVVFLLLIFLLVTTTFKRQEHAFPIELPTSAVEQITVTTDKTTVFIDQSGGVRLLVVPEDAAAMKDGEDVSQPLSRADLRARALPPRRDGTLRRRGAGDASGGVGNSDAKS